MSDDVPDLSRHPILRFPGYGLCFYAVEPLRRQPRVGDYYVAPAREGPPAVMQAATNRRAEEIIVRPTHKASPRIIYEKGQEIRR